MSANPRFRLAELGPQFVRRVLVTTLWAGSVAFLAIAVYAGPSRGLAWGAGLLLGLANLFLLNGFFREMLRPEGGRVRTLALYGALKFPAIYLAGALLLVRLRLDPFLVLAGFSLFLAVAVLKVLGRLTLQTSALARDRQGAGGEWLRKGTQEKSAR